MPYEKVGKNEPVCIADEIPFNIPDTWEWVRLGEIYQHNTGKALNASNRSGELLTYITTSNLYWNRFEIDSLREMYFSESEIEKCTATKGDLLVCEGGDIGRAAIWPYDTDIRIQNHIHRLRPYSEICTEYYYYIFFFYKHAGWIGGKGIGIQGLSANALHALLFPLPPLSEQYRIVTKIKEFEPLLDKYAQAEKRLNNLNTQFPDLLKKSILQEAVQGKLVPQDPTDEPASILLERIRAEKEQLIKAGKIKRDKHESVIFRRDNSHYEKRGSEEICIDEEIPFDLPENWQWVRFSNIAIFENGDRSSKYPVESDYVSDGVPFFGAKDMGEKYMDFDAVRFISEEKFKQLGNGKLKDGDLICLLRGSVGKTRIFKETQKYTTGFICAQMLIIRCLSLEMLDYVYTVINAPYYQTMVEAKITGTAVRQLPAKEVANLLIPIPPAAEQKRILKTITSALLPLKTL